MSLYCEYGSLSNESDVEQKFIYKFLTSSEPLGLGFRDSDIQTKQVLKSYLIDKGGKQKYYVPDYLITIRGIPLLVVEAKTPHEDLNIAYAEARLYAAEVNAKFAHKINVCNKIIVSNGTETWAGYYDCNEPELKLEFEDFSTERKLFVDLLQFCKKEELIKTANEPYIKSRGKAIFNTPVSELGGKRVQDEELDENTYGRTLVFENHNIFDPQTEQDRIEIVKNAYIPSSKREQHIEPIYKEIKRIKLPSEINSTLISTDEPKELIDKLNEHISLNNMPYSLMLLIGNSGSGKTTFIRYFKEVVLNRDYSDLSNKCEWIFINMNSAPINNEEIYKWIKTAIVEQIKNSHSKTNFNHIESLKKLHRADIKAFVEGAGQLIKNDTNTYNEKLFDIITKCTQDSDKNLQAFLRYLKEIESKIPIIVLDNCDKRNKDEQLLMFQVAQWIKETYKCIVILPMRDSTYDIYKQEKPLDTVVKDLVFRIDHADLLKVLQARLDYLYRIKESTTDSYALENGIRIVVKKEEQTEYFKRILMAIRNNTWTMGIFYRLSNRDIRQGIQLFIDLCRSGHIKSEDIFNIRISEDDCEFPHHKIINALLRKNRKYFNEEKSNFANLFYANSDDDFPDPFVRIDILLWLKKYKRIEGPSRIQGYHKIDSVIKDLQTIGHNETIIFREINSLIKKGLIYSETQFLDVNYGDLISLSSSGFLHLQLLKNLSYLGACAEDVIYKSPQTMTKISRRIASTNYLDKLLLTATAKDMIDYLLEYRKEFLSQPEVYLKDDQYSAIYDLKDPLDLISNILETDSHVSKVINALEKYPIGSEITCKIVNKRDNSLLCLFGDGLRCFLSPTDKKYKLTFSDYNLLKEGDELRCKIIEYVYCYNSFNLEFIEHIKLKEETASGISS